MSVRVTRPAVAFGQDSGHSSAPSLCRSASGRLFMVYRQGTDHYVSRDGVLMLTYTDDGCTWSPPAQVLSLLPTWDLQGQGISESRDGTTLWLTYFKASATTSAAGVFMRASTDQGVTWSVETRIDNLTIAATTDVIIDQADGSLLLGLYGRATAAETNDSAFVARSTDRGVTWTLTRLKDGTADGRAYQEPVLATQGSMVVVAFRWGTIQSIGSASSFDYGVTWTSPGVRFAGTGKPHVFWIDDQLACIYRELNTGHARVRSSHDGVSWSPPRMAHPTYYPGGWMLYSSNAGQVVAFAEERTSPSASPGVARLFLAAAGTPGTDTSSGTIPDSQTDVAARLEELAFATRFEQTDGPVSEPWSAVAHNGGPVTPVVADGQLSPAAMNVGTLSRVYVSQLSDLEAEADIFTAAGSGSSVGLVFRMVSSGTYLLAAAEDNNFRLYGFLNGSLIGGTYLLSVPNVHAYDRWNRHKVIARGGRIYAFYNDVLLVNYGLSTTDQATFAGGYYHGVKLLAQAGGPSAHRCRRFTLRG